MSADLSGVKAVSCLWMIVALLAPMPALAGAGDNRVDQQETEIKLEFVQEEPDVRGVEVSVSYGLTETLQIEAIGVTFRDRREIPRTKISGPGLELEWRPFALDNGLTAGLKLSFGRETERNAVGEKEVDRTRGGALILEWEAANFSVDWQIGYDYSKVSDERTSDWGTSITLGGDLSDTIDAEIELDKQVGEKVSVELAVGMELVDDLNLILSVGRQSTRNFGAVGLEFSF